MSKELALKDLKEFLSTYKEDFDKNLHRAYQDYMESKIRNGAFQYVLSRHDNLYIILSEEIEKIIKKHNADLLHLYKVAVNLTIDFRYIVREEKRFLDWVCWWNFFRNKGFTEINPFFRIPAIPITVVP